MLKSSEGGPRAVGSSGMLCHFCVFGFETWVNNGWKSELCKQQINQSVCVELAREFLGDPPCLGCQRCCKGLGDKRRKALNFS